MKKINKFSKNMAQKGFTLIEMIGVLAVIAILAGMLIPKIFEAMRNSRVNATLEAYNTIKAAVVDHIAKWGKIATTAGTAYTSGSSFDSILFQEGRLDGRAADKIPLSTLTGTTAVYVNVTGATGAAGGSGYYLAGATGGNSTANAAAVVELIIKSVPAQDAQDLSMRLDGPNLSVTTLGAGDTIGRVVYSAATGGKTDVYMYITHQ